MGDSISSISSFIEEFWWLYYVFCFIGSLFSICAVDAFRSQFHITKAKIMGITNPELREIIKQWDIKPPQILALWAVLLCVHGSFCHGCTAIQIKG